MPTLGRIARIGLLAMLLVVVGTIALVLPWRWVPPPTTAFMIRERIVSGAPVAYDWTPIENVSPQLPIAVVAAEDQKFPDHGGFDWEAIQVARERNQRGEGALRGGSTITQQLAKNLYLWPAQSWVRKGIETYLTAWIELLWPKGRILEVYVNVVEFGPGVFGAGAAAEHLVGSPVEALTAREAATLAAVLPSPKRLSARSPSTYVQGRAEQIMRFMRQLGGPSYLAELWPDHGPNQ